MTLSVSQWSDRLVAYKSVHKPPIETQKSIINTVLGKACGTALGVVVTSALAIVGIGLGAVAAPTSAYAASNTEIAPVTPVATGTSGTSGTSTSSTAASLAATDTAADGSNGYLWLHFGATDYEKVYLGYSADGFAWQKVSSDPAITSTVGTKGLRDPHIIRLHTPDADGNQFVMIGTDLHAEGSAPGGSWDQIHASTDLVVAKSADAIHWTEPVLVPTGLAGKVGNAWAPEAIWDAQTQDYLVYWSSRDLSTGGASPTTSNTALKVYKAHTADFLEFTNPQVWLDQSSANMHNIIDTTVVQGEDQAYYRFSTSDWWTVIDRATQLDGPWTRIVERDSDIQGGVSTVTGDKVISTTDSGLSTHIEGLTVYQLPDSRWMVMGDASGYNGWIINRLADIGAGGKFAIAQTSFSQKFRHGTVIPLTAQEQNTLLETYNLKPLEPVQPDADGAGPIAQYTFEDGKGTDSIGNYDLQFYGKVTVQTDTATTARAPHTQVLTLDGSDGTYAQFPSAVFERRNALTVSMDVMSEINTNQFTFTFGQDNNTYYFMKYNNSGQIGSRITTGSWQHEAAANATVDGNGAWHRVTIVLDNATMKLYIDGILAASNDATGVTVIQLGADLKAYLGKSLYPDPYFKGAFDNITVWNRALTAAEVAQADHAPMLAKATVGTVPTTEEAAALRGTDDHTAVRTVLDQQSRTITSVINQRADRTAVPVTLQFGWDGLVSTVDGKPFTNGDVLDMSRDHTVVISEGDASSAATTQSETWTLKAATVSNNPVLPGQYADPDIDYFDGKFWIFPTTDGFSGWSGNYFHAFSSPDAQHWTDEGIILDVNRDHTSTTDGDERTAVSPWSVGSAWAPTIEHKNGKYYFYYCAKFPNGESAIGVAVADNPAGPYQPSEQPLVTRSMEGVTVGQAIDPSIFTDTDGTSYILYGNGSPAIAQLGSDMTSIVPGSVHRIDGLKNFRESVVVSVHDGKYYWTWSCDDAGSPNYHVEYGISDSLQQSNGTYGPTDYKGVLLEKDTAKGIQGTAHQSDVQVIDAQGEQRWILAYHRHYTPLGVFTDGLGYHRETALDELHTDADGNLLRVQPTDEGVGAVVMADGTALADALESAASVVNAASNVDSETPSDADGHMYKPELWSAFTAARLDAIRIYDQLMSKGAAQRDVDDATAELTRAQSALATIEPDTPETDTPEVDTSGDSNDGHSDSANNSASTNNSGSAGHSSNTSDTSASNSQISVATQPGLAQTGSAIALLALIVLLSAGLSAALLYLQHRYENRG